MDQKTQEMLLAYRAALAENPAGQRTIREMFRTYNQMIEPREYSTTCAGCVNRVLRRVREYLTSQGLV